MEPVKAIASYSPPKPPLLKRVVRRMWEFPTVGWGLLFGLYFSPVIWWPLTSFPKFVPPLYLMITIPPLIISEVFFFSKLLTKSDNPPPRFPLGIWPFS